MKSGKWLLDILVTGKKTVKMALEYNFTKTAISMKVCGEVTKDMDKVHIGEMKAAN